jgi:hypothetical protein
LLLWHESWGGEVHRRLHIPQQLLLLLWVSTISCLGMKELGGWRGELKGATVTSLHGCSCTDLCNFG